ncbi:adenine methyltransferase [Vibrio parahaemolyticus]|nr:adenine methyltransferase [Vibrio parahaemolyticus]EJC7066886.1 adenine methyltransferase [Vibrio parahaemolyticus]
MATLNNHGSLTDKEFRDQTSTPDWLFQAYNAEFDFDVDAAATKESAKCPIYFTPETDGLGQDWAGAVIPFKRTTVWVNPPYSDIGPWMLKAKEEQAKGVTTVLLVPHDNRAEWWPWAIASEIRDIVGYHEERTYKSGKRKGEKYQKWVSGGIKFINASTREEMPHELNKPICAVVFDPYHVGPCIHKYVTKRDLMDRGRAILNQLQKAA